MSESVWLISAPMLGAGDIPFLSCIVAKGLEFCCLNLNWKLLPTCLSRIQNEIPSSIFVRGVGRWIIAVSRKT